MASYQVFKETAVPGSLVANGIYIITDPNNANFLSVYVTDNAGVATRRTPNQADIQALIASAQGNANFVVADITARDALTPATGDTAWVTDASADGTVDSGAAQYVWDGSAWVKISEAESMDITINWSDVVGRPSSSAAAIDAAVSNSHTHANKTQIDKIGENGDGDPTYDGTDLVLTGSTAW